MKKCDIVMLLGESDGYTKRRHGTTDLKQNKLLANVKKKEMKKIYTT